MVWVEVAVMVSVLGVLAHWRYTPNPPGGVSDRPLRMESLRMKKIIMDIASVLEFLHLTTIVHFVRALRAYFTSPLPRQHSQLKVTETTFDGVKVVVQEPLSTQKKTNVPGLVFFVGGGFYMGSPADCFHVTSHLAIELGTVVVAVEYRLAPEHVFPAGVNDCVTATKYFLKNAKSYNVDPSRIGVVGESAGGNLAAVVALRLAQEKHAPGLKLQLILYPATQFLQLTESAHKYGPCEDISEWELAYLTSHYLYGNKSVVHTALENQLVKKLEGTHFLNFLDPSLVDPTLPPLPPGKVVRREDAAAGHDLLKKVLNPHLSPLFALEEDIRGLPPAFVTVNEFDSLRDHGIFYAARLERAGVKVKMIHYKDGYHGQIMCFRTSERGKGMMEDVLVYLKENL